MKCKKCGYECYGIVDVENRLCMECYDDLKRQNKI